MSRGCQSRHCRACGGLLGVRGRCLNRACPESPLFPYAAVQADLYHGVRRAEQLAQWLAADGEPGATEVDS